MNACYAGSPHRRLFDVRFPRNMLVLLIVAALTWSGTSITITEASADASADSTSVVDEMLRGDLSPVAAEPEVAGVSIRAEPKSVSDMLRGDISPIEAEPEVAAVAVQPTSMTVEEMLRGDLSPIS